MRDVQVIVQHQQFTISECGFFIHAHHHFMGTSPDGLVNCRRCGEGICENKVSHTAFTQGHG